MRSTGTPIVRILAAGLLAWLAGCTDGKRGIVGPEGPAVPAFAVVVSDPVPAARPALERGAPRLAGTAGDSVVYVSMPPGTVPGGVRADIRNLARGSTGAALLVDGGFDPVAVPAGVGDSVEIKVTRGDGTTARAVAAVAARRPPVVVRTEPPHKKTDVPLNAVIVAVFSEPMDATTVNTQTVRLSVNNQPVDGSLTPSPDGLRAEFHAATPLAPRTEYTLVITTAVADRSGDRLEQPVEVTFTTLAGGGNRIAFHSDRSGNWDIFVMNPDGSGVVNLTNNLATDTDPAWSPDGSKIAFVSGRDGLCHIYVMNPDGTGVRLVTSGPDCDSDPSWSPDGSKIAFERCCGILSSDIYVINDDGTGLTQLTRDSSFNEQPSWSPDRSRIAFVSYVAGALPDIYVMNSDGSGRTNLTNDPRHDVYPAWSPDGSRICFSTTRDGNTEIYLMNPDGTGLANLTQNPARYLGCGWSPEGSKLLFGTTRDGNEEIYSMNPDGTGAVNLTKHPAADESPAWSRR